MLTSEAPHALGFEDYAQQSAPAEVSHQAPAPSDIAAEAYNLYLARGCQDGFDVEDWLAAEELLRAR